MTRRRLPIGLQTFRELREEGCYYVDKTGFIARLLDRGKHYFLSRPRRFGKSLFLDTLKELFEGSEPLFAGLHIHDRWDWSVRHPVVRLDFGAGHFGEPGYVHASTMAQLAAAAEDAGVPVRYDTAPERFRDLLRTLHARTGRRVVVLVDEYDKPILDALEAPAVAHGNRDYLRGLHGTIKSSDAHVRFTFLTGVSRSPQRGSARGHPSHEKASKVSVFSGLNNLTDLTLDPCHSAICGYTEADLDTVFAPELAGLDRDRIRDWYNGYNWLGTERVYNPFDILLLFGKREFGCYWFETGTPAFLVDTLFERRVSSLALDGMLANHELLSSFDIEAIATEALLFQTGYLTIKEARDRGGVRRYRLGYPNREVRQSFNGSLLRRLVQDATRQTANSDRLYDLMEKRLREHGGAVPGVLREHSLRVVHEQRRRQLRGLLRERVLFLLRGVGLRRDGGGLEQPRPGGHGGALRRQRLPVRVQGGGAGERRRRAGAAPGAGLRRQVPRVGRADPPDRRGVQPGDTQRDGVRGGAGLMPGIEVSPRSIVNQIKSRLQDRYASGYPILKELVQNADDAQARRVRLDALTGRPDADNPLLRGPGPSWPTTGCSV